MSKKRDYSLEDLRSNMDRDIRLIVRLKRYNFAKLLLYLKIKFENESFVYTKEIAKFLMITNTYAYNLLEDFVSFGLLRKKVASGNLVMWEAVLNSKDPLLNKYVKYAKKTLGVGL